MQDGRERRKKKHKRVDFGQDEGNAASDIACRSIFRWKEEYMPRAETSKSTKQLTSKYQDSAAISSLRRKSLNRTTLETETSGRYLCTRKEVEQENNFLFR